MPSEPVVLARLATHLVELEAFARLHAIDDVAPHLERALDALDRRMTG